MKNKQYAPFVLLNSALFALCAVTHVYAKTATIATGDDPNFKIVPNHQQQLAEYNRKVMVFGVPIYAAPKVDDDKLLHAANLMAQYLDNDEDGKVDNPKVMNAMLKANAALFMWKFESDLSEPPSYISGQDLGSDETNPSYVSKGQVGRFDAALEEVWHLISNAGYANAYPAIFGTEANTALTKAMDNARGGHYVNIPKTYPKTAWYRYLDSTCDYQCQAAEYIYWALSSILGAQKNRLNAIQHEWQLNTKAKVKAKDRAVYHLLTKDVYKLPSRLPDGTYKR